MSALQQSALQQNPSTPMFVVTTIHRDGICVLSIVGHLADTIVRLIDAEVPKLVSCRHLIVDLLECSAVSAVGPELLRRLRDALPEHGTMVVVAGAPIGSSVVSSAGLDELVSCYEMLADGLAAARIDRTVFTRTRAADAPAPTNRQQTPGLRLVGGRCRYSAEWL